MEANKFNIGFDIKWLGIYSTIDGKVINEPILERGFLSYRIKVIKQYKYFLWIKYKTINYENL